MLFANLELIFKKQYGEQFLESLLHFLEICYFEFLEIADYESAASFLRIHNGESNMKIFQQLIIFA